MGLNNLSAMVGEEADKAFEHLRAIRQAVEFSRSGLIEDITENVEHMRLTARSAAVDGSEE